jgi:8-oxo-dGTP diphosphatase
MCFVFQGTAVMSLLLPTLTVVAGLIRQADRWLVCQRRRDASFALKWEFPGGKVQPGEALEVALRRELREELNIDADVGPERYRTRHHYPKQYTVELIFFEILAFRGTLQNHVFEQIRWASLDVLPSLDFLEGDAELIVRLGTSRNVELVLKTESSYHGL